MIQVSAKDFKQSTGKYQDMAQHEPVLTTKHDRYSCVLLSFEDYQRLTGATQQAQSVRHLGNDVLNTLRASHMPQTLNHLNDELHD